MRDQSIPSSKTCEMCGCRMERRIREGAKAFARRRTCGIKCGHALSWRNREDRIEKLSASMRARYADRSKVCTWCGVVFRPRPGESHHGFWKRQTCCKEHGVELCLFNRYRNRKKGRQWRYPRSWTDALKARIRERDGHRCRLCGDAGTEAPCVHHIDYDKDNLTDANLISLCRSCHGKTNYRRAYWQALFSALMTETGN